MASIASLTRKTFKEHGLTPKKWMGQNLLVDQRYLERIVRAASVKPGEHVVEVGAGLGVLTEALANEGAEVWAFEIDAGFFRVLEDRLRSRLTVHLIHEDVLKYDFRELFGRLGRLRVVANLPYSISSRLIFRFFEHRELFDSLTILLQREVAERLAATAGSKDYGVLTVLLGVSASVELLFDIPGRAFYPVPEVTSTLVRITFPKVPPVTVSNPRMLVRVVKAAFAARRKTLRNNMRSRMKIASETMEKAAADTAIDLDRRGETLTPDEFARFTDALIRHG
ncbi:MAG: 16S rRNA (adenine(1518)-N(6)/adenine(1519)-N(6))-dimethyltransferase RsmA [Desulfomonile sp.]|nr:16S rRNA (adenine(1518)-N(6)/adenine(1519)-N(6))-dimethyltransferase RsmA [Desulfomonile sp.]